MRICGAGTNGSDIDLLANLTTNDREIAFTTPEHLSPLSAGSFAVQLSLNGGADFSGGPAHAEQVRSVFWSPAHLFSTLFSRHGFGWPSLLLG